MKLLLTSGGMTNGAITEAMFKLSGTTAETTKLAFIPTVANGESGGKEWLIDDLYRLKQLRLKQIDIADISALDRQYWEPQLREADIIFVGGGNTFYLMHWMKKSGLAALLPELLETRLYVGLSAGSIITGPDVKRSSHREWYPEDVGPDSRAFGFVDFYFRSHLNSRDFPNITSDKMPELAKKVGGPLYVLDDQCAMVADGEKLEVIGGGEYLTYNV